MEEKRLMVSGVIQCFYFSKRGMGSARFKRGKKHAR
jgi:hypothetical protein